MEYDLVRWWGICSSRSAHLRQWLEIRLSSIRDVRFRLLRSTTRKPTSGAGDVLSGQMAIWRNAAYSDIICDMRQRSSNFEILRIVAMLMIVAGHFVSQGVLAGSSMANEGLALMLGSCSRMAVNIFLLIGAWFMVDAAFRPERILDLYLQVVFYTIPLTAVMLLLGCAGGARNVIQGFLPFLGRPVWFVCAYMSLIALTPFLNRVFTWNDAVLRKLVLLLGLLFAVVGSIPSFTPFEYLADFSWFVVVYLAVGAGKKATLFDRLPGKWTSLLLGVMLIALLAVGRIFPATAFLVNYWGDHLQSLPNILAALFVFNFFRLLDIGTVRAVNFAARSTLAVYIIHQTPAFRDFEWNVVFRAKDVAHLSSPLFVVAVIGVAAGTFVGAAVVDNLYWKRLAPRISESRFYGCIIRALKRFYAETMP